jgi:hypothetical protein
MRVIAKKMCRAIFEAPEKVTVSQFCSAFNVNSERR